MAAQIGPESKKLTEFLDSAQVIPGFSCLAMKDEAQALLRAELAGMTPEEELAWWQARHEERLALQAELRVKADD